VSAKSLSLTKAAGYGTAVSFNVAPGQARLNVSASLAGVVDISLISPSGDLAEFNLPQGVGNYGNAEVADPAPGQWTALVSTSSAAASVPAKFQASTATWRQFGTLSARSVTLAPGASKTVGLTVATPSRPGDEAGSLILHSSASGPAFTSVTSVPVTLRSLIPAPSPAYAFTGTLTGGNGRQSNSGQTVYYQMQIPAGDKALNVSVTTGSAANTMLAELVSPSGLAASTAVNGLQTTTPGGSGTLQPEKGTQLHVLSPAAGTWTLIVDFYNTVSGTAVAQPFRVTINDLPAGARTFGLPDSAGSQLAAGQPVVAHVKITNHGPSPEAYFIDARLPHQVTENLAPQTVSSLTLPNVTGVVPEYLVPSQTTQVSAQVTAPAAQFFDLSYPFGDPDLISSFGKTSSVGFASPNVPDGSWYVTPFLVGPTGATAAKNVTASVSVSATTAAFDPAVSSPTGDMWLSSLNASAGFTPYVVNPGQSVTIPVTITPAGAAGSTVSGTLYLDDSSVPPGAVTYNEIPGQWPDGSEVAAFPYSYTIK
jgi:hypothetical protein